MIPRTDYIPDELRAVLRGGEYALDRARTGTLPGEVVVLIGPGADGSRFDAWALSFDDSPAGWRAAALPYEDVETALAVSPDLSQRLATFTENYPGGYVPAVAFWAGGAALFGVPIVPLSPHHARA